MTASDVATIPVSGLILWTIRRVVIASRVTLIVSLLEVSSNTVSRPVLPYTRHRATRFPHWAVILCI